MEDSFKTLLFGFILISLFGMLILTAVVNVGNTYGKDTSEIVGGSLSLQQFNNSINNIESDALSLQERFNKQSIWSAVVGIVVDGIFGIAKDMVTMITLPFAIVSNIMIDMFNIPTYVTSVILGLLILAIMFGIWNLLKVGN